MTRLKKTSRYERVENDFYQEEPNPVQALLQVERFNGWVMDPCCGEGNIPLVMRSHGIRANGADIVDRWAQALAVGDFRNTLRFWRPDCVVSNPPYNCWEEIVDVSFESGASHVCLLLPFRRVEGIERRRFWARRPLARQWVSSERLIMRPGGKASGKGEKKQECFSWFVWEAGHTSPVWQTGLLPLVRSVGHD